MFFTKRRKIESWLKNSAPSPFADLLSQQLSGQMRERLTALDLARQEYHIDWLDDYKCINIQARLGKLYVDIQIEPDVFFIAMDEDEPDEPLEFPLASAESLYEGIRTFLHRTA